MLFALYVVAHLLALAFALLFDVALSVDMRLLMPWAIVTACVAHVSWARTAEDTARGAVRWVKGRRKAKLSALLLSSAIGCAHQPAARPVEPTAAPASIDRLTCGGRSCSITEAGGATMVWISE